MAKRRRSSRYSVGQSLGRMINSRLRAQQRAAEVEAARQMLQDVGAEAHARVGTYGTTRLLKPRTLAGVNALYGRGKYSLGTLGRTAAGKHIGRALIKAAVGGIGRLSGQGLYTGRGAYLANSLMDDRPPQVVSSAADETGAVTISRLEFLTEVYGPTTAFNVQTFSINPGLESTFPWLSQIAQNYEEYEMVQLVFSYRSTTTDIGSTSNGQCGTVIMATNYDAGAAPFGDKKIMMAYDGAMSSKTTESMAHGVECDPDKLSGSVGKYVRAFGLDSSRDIKDYDQGLFQLAIANSPSGFQNQSIGELWVSYTVKLRKPKFFSARGLNVSRDIFVSGNGTESNTAIMGTNAALLRGLCNNINTILTLGTNVIDITFPADFAGVVEVGLRSEGSFTAATLSPSVVSGNIVAYDDMYGSSASGGDTPNAVTFSWSANQIIALVRLRISPSSGGANNVYRLSYTCTGSMVQSSLEIKEINAGFSYRYANISQSDAPILVNQSGVIVVP